MQHSQWLERTDPRALSQMRLPCEVANDPRLRYPFLSEEAHQSLALTLGSCSYNNIDRLHTVSRNQHNHQRKMDGGGWQVSYTKDKRRPQNSAGSYILIFFVQPCSCSATLPNAQKVCILYLGSKYAVCGTGSSNSFKESARASSTR